jgi:hypothetical protein
MDMGSLPEWLSLGAAVSAALAGIIARRLSLRSAAACLYFTVALPTIDQRSTRIKLVNPGAWPIRRVCVTEWDVGRRYFTWRLRRYPRWMTGRCMTGRGYWTVEPGSSLEIELPIVSGLGPGDEGPPVMVGFRDGQGRRRVRWSDGKLTRLYPSVYWLQERHRQRRARAMAEWQRVEAVP